MHGLSASPKRNLDDEFGDSTMWQETTGNSKMPHAEAHKKDIDELTLKSLAKSIFELQQSECSVDLCASSLSNSSEASTSCSVVNVLNSQPFLFHNYVLIVLLLVSDGYFINLLSFKGSQSEYVPLFRVS